ncbi:MAG TPA: hypothetical protein VL860_01605 [Planctomycetota bacterium]|nr:hypothetical protein [Planctomycetota bacterium]
MDRKEYLTLIYNVAHEAWTDNQEQIRDIIEEGKANPEALAELREILHPYIQEVLKMAGSLEDILRESILREIPQHVWQKEERWEMVLIGAAYECLQFDCLGVLGQIAQGLL